MKKNLKRSFKLIAWGLILAMLLTSIPLSAVAESGSPASTLVINQIYGNGGDSTATAVSHSFIELYNPTSSTINLNGYSVQLAKGTESTWQKLDLTGSVPSGHSFLIVFTKTSSPSSAYVIPEYDQAWANLDMYNKEYKVALLSSTALLDVNNPAELPQLVDLVGAYDGDASKVTGYLGAAVDGSTKKKSVRRIDFQDTRNNSEDFESLDYTKATAEVLAAKRPHSLADGVFAPPPTISYTITAAAGAGGAVTGSGAYDSGTGVTLTATPDPNFQFEGWYENGLKLANADAAYTFIATASRSLEAKFVRVSFPIVPLKYGALHVEGKYIKDSANTTLTLNGVTVTEPERVNAASFYVLQNDWNADFVRVTPSVTASLAVKLATDAGLYTVVDYTGTDAAGAAKYLAAIAYDYKDNPGVIYAFSGVASGGQSIVNEIRRFAPSALIIAGSPSAGKRPDQAAVLTGSNILYALSIDCAESAATPTTTYLSALSIPVFVTQCKLTMYNLEAINYRADTWKTWRADNSVGGSWGDFNTTNSGLLTGELNYIIRGGYRKYKDTAPAQPTDGLSVYDLTDSGQYAKAVMKAAEYAPRPIGNVVYKWDFESGLQGWNTTAGSGTSLGTAESQALKITRNLNVGESNEWCTDQTRVPYLRTTNGAGTDISNVKWLYFEYYIQDSGLTKWGTFNIEPHIGSSDGNGSLNCEQTAASFNWGVPVGNNLLKFSALVHTRDMASGTTIAQGQHLSELMLISTVFGYQEYSGDIYFDNIMLLSDIAPTPSPNVPLPLPDTGLPVVSINTANTNDPLISKAEQLPCSFDITADGEYPELSFAISKGTTIKTRGSSSSSYFPKLGYQVKFDKKQDVLGMGSAKKWVLISNYADKTAIQSELAYAMEGFMAESRYGGNPVPYTIQTRNVELIINGVYDGTYMLASKVESGSARIDINTAAEGYIIEHDAKFEEDPDTRVLTSRNRAMYIKEPEPGDKMDSGAVAGQNVFNPIRSRIQAVENSLYNNTWQSNIDVNSWIDFYLVNEIMMNWDENNNSGFMWSESLTDTLKAGPVWDFDGAIGQIGEALYWNKTNYDPNSYWVEQWVTRTGHPWFAQLFTYNEFKNAVIARYTYLRNNGLLEQIDSIIESYRTELTFSQALNEQRWHSLKLGIWPSTGVVLPSWDSNVTRLKTMLNSRLRWLDIEYYNGTLPQLRSITVTAATGGTAIGANGDTQFRNGSEVTVTAAPNVGYSFDGWYNGSSRVSTALNYTFTATANVTLQARFTAIPVTAFAVLASATAGGTASGNGSYTQGTVATASAVPNSGYYFDGWYESGTLASSAASYSFAPSAARVLEARFTSTPVERYTITATAGTVGGEVTGGGEYSAGANVTLSAAADSTHVFEGWYENESKLEGAGASYTFAAEASRTLEARFTELYRTGVSLIINQIYGNGGDATATAISHSFIELYNPTDSTVDLSGCSLQIAKGTESTWQKLDLVGSVPPKHSFLVAFTKTVSPTAAYTITEYDQAWAGIDMYNKEYKAALVSSLNLLSVNNPAELPQLVDLVGAYDGDASKVTGYLGAPVDGSTKKKAVLRIDLQDTRNNAADFESLDYTKAAAEVIDAKHPRSIAEGAWPQLPAIEFGITSISTPESLEAGSPLTFITNTIGGQAPIKYSYYVYAEGKVYYSNSYSLENSFSYSFPAAGTYTVAVYADDFNQTRVKHVILVEIS
ncbi:MAG: CotH kinase family protein [Oscillospiraceae bacterium]|nr:CotH kinase family protein [Oscillospiraceae bacterium]